MTIEELRSEIASGAIDTVVIAMTDMQGRLVGKRVHGPVSYTHLTLPTNREV